MIVISSCSNKQLIKTELQTVYKIKYKPIDRELLTLYPRIKIKEKSNYQDVFSYLLQSLNYNILYETKIKSIEELTNDR